MMISQTCTRCNANMATRKIGDSNMSICDGCVESVRMPFMRLITTGVTRWVFLVGPWAFKFPRPTTYRLFLRGLLANGKEAEWWRRTHDERLAPVLLAIWGGWLVVMRRCAPPPLKPASGGSPELDFACAPVWAGPSRAEMERRFDGLPVEFKKDSFGMLGGELVAVDYGS